MQKISIKNITITISVFIILFVMVIYFLMLVPITIVFKSDTPDEIIQGAINDIDGQLIKEHRSEDRKINWLIMYVPRWERILHMEKLKNNLYVENVYDEDFLLDVPFE